MAAADKWLISLDLDTGGLVRGLRDIRGHLDALGRAGSTGGSPAIGGGGFTALPSGSAGGYSGGGGDDGFREMAAIQAASVSTMREQQQLASRSMERYRSESETQARRQVGLARQYSESLQRTVELQGGILRSQQNVIMANNYAADTIRRRVDSAYNQVLAVTMPAQTATTALPPAPTSTPAPLPIPIGTGSRSDRSAPVPIVIPAGGRTAAGTGTSGPITTNPRQNAQLGTAEAQLIASLTSKSSALDAQTAIVRGNLGRFASAERELVRALEAKTQAIRASTGVMSVSPASTTVGALPTGPRGLPFGAIPQPSTPLARPTPPTWQTPTALPSGSRGALPPAPPSRIPPVFTGTYANQPVMGGNRSRSAYVADQIITPGGTYTPTQIRGNQLDERNMEAIARRILRTSPTISQPIAAQFATFQGKLREPAGYNFYHGTSARLKPGDVIEPRQDGLLSDMSGGMAWAARDSYLAERYARQSARHARARNPEAAPYIYKVRPLSVDDMSRIDKNRNAYSDPRHYGSTQGFTVLGEVPVSDRSIADRSLASIGRQQEIRRQIEARQPTTFQGKPSLDARVEQQIQRSVQRKALEEALRNPNTYSEVIGSGANSIASRFNAGGQSYVRREIVRGTWLPELRDRTDALMVARGIPGVERLAAVDENYTPITRLAPGPTFFDYTHGTRGAKLDKPIPSRHVLQYARTLAQLGYTGLDADAHGKNVLYDRKAGFTAIDFMGADRFSDPLAQDNLSHGLATLRQGLNAGVPFTPKAVNTLEELRGKRYWDIIDESRKTVKNRLATSRSPLWQRSRYLRLEHNDLLGLSPEDAFDGKFSTFQGKRNDDGLTRQLQRSQERAALNSVLREYASTPEGAPLGTLLGGGNDAKAFRFDVANQSYVRREAVGGQYGSTLKDRTEALSLAAGIPGVERLVALTARGGPITRLAEGRTLTSIGEAGGAGIQPIPTRQVMGYLDSLARLGDRGLMADAYGDNALYSPRAGFTAIDYMNVGRNRTLRRDNIEEGMGALYEAQEAGVPFTRGALRALDQVNPDTFQAKPHESRPRGFKAGLSEGYLDRSIGNHFDRPQIESMMSTIDNMNDRFPGVMNASRDGWYRYNESSQLRRRIQKASRSQIESARVAGRGLIHPLVDRDVDDPFLPNSDTVFQFDPTQALGLSYGTVGTSRKALNKKLPATQMAIALAPALAANASPFRSEGPNIPYVLSHELGHAGLNRDTLPFVQQQLASIGVRENNVGGLDGTGLRQLPTRYAAKSIGETVAESYAAEAMGFGDVFTNRLVTGMEDILLRTIPQRPMLPGDPIGRVQSAADARTFAALPNGRPAGSALSTGVASGWFDPSMASFGDDNLNTMMDRIVQMQQTTPALMRQVRQSYEAFHSSPEAQRDFLGRVQMGRPSNAPRLDLDAILEPRGIINPLQIMRGGEGLLSQIYGGNTKASRQSLNTGYAGIALNAGSDSKTAGQLPFGVGLSPNAKDLAGSLTHELGHFALTPGVMDSMQSVMKRFRITEGADGRLGGPAVFPSKYAQTNVAELIAESYQHVLGGGDNRLANRVVETAESRLAADAAIAAEAVNGLAAAIARLNAAAQSGGIHGMQQLVGGAKVLPHGVARGILDAMPEGGFESFAQLAGAGIPGLGAKRLEALAAVPPVRPIPFDMSALPKPPLALPPGNFYPQQRAARLEERRTLGAQPGISTGTSPLALGPSSNPRNWIDWSKGPTLRQPMFDAAAAARQSGPLNIEGRQIRSPEMQSRVQAQIERSRIRAEEEAALGASGSNARARQRRSVRDAQRAMEVGDLSGLSGSQRRAIAEGFRPVQGNGIPGQMWQQAASGQAGGLGRARDLRNQIGAMPNVLEKAVKDTAAIEDSLDRGVFSNNTRARRRAVRESSRLRSEYGLTNEQVMFARDRLYEQRGSTGQAPPGYGDRQANAWATPGAGGAGRGRGGSGGSGGGNGRGGRGGSDSGDGRNRAGGYGTGPFGRLYQGVQESSGLAGFFGRGALSTVKYGLPAMALYGAAGGMTDAIREAEELQYNMKLLEGQISDTFGDESGNKIAQIKGEIIGLAKETGIGADLIAQMEKRIRGSFSGEVVGGMSGERLVVSQRESAAKLAAVTKIPIDQVSNELTAASLGFDVTFKTLGDIATGLETKTGVSSGELINFLGDVAPVADEAGFTAEQIAGIGSVILQRSGRGGAAIAEGLNRVIPAMTAAKPQLQELAAITPALQTPEFLEAVNSGDAATQFTILTQEFGNLNKEAQDFVINLLGGRREAQYLIPAFANSAKIEEFTKTAENSVGSLDERFKKVQETLTNALARLGEHFRALAVDILDLGLADIFAVGIAAVSGFLQVVTPLIGAVSGLNDALGGIPAKLLAVYAVYKLFTGLKGAGMLGMGGLGNMFGPKSPYAKDAPQNLSRLALPAGGAPIFQTRFDRIRDGLLRGGTAAADSIRQGPIMTRIQGTAIGQSGTLNPVTGFRDARAAAGGSGALGRAAGLARGVGGGAAAGLRLGGGALTAGMGALIGSPFMGILALTAAYSFINGKMDEDAANIKALVEEIRSGNEKAQNMFTNGDETALKDRSAQLRREARDKGQSNLNRFTTWITGRRSEREILNVEADTLMSTEQTARLAAMSGDSNIGNRTARLTFVDPVAMRERNATGTRRTAKEASDEFNRIRREARDRVAQNEGSRGGFDWTLANPFRLTKELITQSIEGDGSQESQDLYKRVRDIGGYKEDEKAQAKVMEAVLSDNPIEELQKMLDEGQVNDTDADNVRTYLKKFDETGLADSEISKAIKEFDFDSKSPAEQQAITMERLQKAFAAGDISLGKYLDNTRLALKRRRNAIYGVEGTVDYDSALKLIEEENANMAAIGQAKLGRIARRQENRQVFGMAEDDLGDKSAEENLALLRARISYKGVEATYGFEYTDPESRRTAAIAVIEQRRRQYSETYGLAKTDADRKRIEQALLDDEGVKAATRTIRDTEIQQSDFYMDAGGRYDRGRSKSPYKDTSGDNLFLRVSEDMADGSLDVGTASILTDQADYFTQEIGAAKKRGDSKESIQALEGSLEFILALMQFGGFAADKIAGFAEAGGVEGRGFRMPNMEEYKAKINKQAALERNAARYNVKRAQQNGDPAGIALVDMQEASEAMQAAKDEFGEDSTQYDNAYASYLEAQTAYSQAIRQRARKQYDLAKAVADANKDSVGSAQASINAANATLRDPSATTEEKDAAQLELIAGQAAKRDAQTQLFLKQFDLRAAQGPDDGLAQADLGLQRARAFQSRAVGDEQIDAEIAVAEAERARMNALRERFEAAFSLRRAQVGGDSMAAADIERQAAQFAVQFARENSGAGSAAALQAEARLVEAERAWQNARTARIEALYGLTKAREGNDPLNSSARDIQMLTALLAEAKKRGDIDAIISLETRLVDAQRAQADAMNDVRLSMMEMRQAELLAYGDEIGAAQMSAEMARAQLQNAISTQQGPAAINRARAEVVRAEKAARDTIFQERMSDAKWMLDMGTISKSQYISMLEDMKSVLVPGSREMKDLELMIKQFKDDVGGDLQANMPTTFDLPTIYEVRRLSQSSQAGVTTGDPTGTGTGIGYQDNRQVSIVVQTMSNDVTDQVVQVMNDALGVNRNGQGVRRY